MSKHIHLKKILEFSMFLDLKAKNAEFEMSVITKEHWNEPEYQYPCGQIASHGE